MAQVAYNLEHFAPARNTARPRPGLRVAKKRRAQRARPVWRMVRTLLAVSLLMALVCAVLYTQTTVNELQRDIARMEKRMTEEEALNAHLTFQLENMTSLKGIEERAVEMGMEKVSNGQITYYRVDDGGSIEVKENPLARLFEQIRSGFLDIVGNLVP